ncbi:hypothetical protein BS78_07G082100 [Paspalum vaginatum]|nr:hypothetical protein BS78_07G082100 [Paspalum vaginatum]
MANKRAQWTEVTTKTLLDLCIVEKNVLNFNTKGLTTVGWENVTCKFREQTGETYDGRQLYTKLSGLRRTYKHWNNGGVVADDSYWRTEEGDTCDAEPTRGKPPSFLEELEILFGRNTQDKGNLISAGGVRATNDTFDTPHHTINDPFEQSDDRSRSKRPIGEQTMDSPPKKKNASIEECLRDISEAMLSRRSRKSNNYDVAEHDQNAVNRMRFIGIRTKEGREQWIQFNWANK